MHYYLPGRVPAPGFQNDTEAVTLHLFIKELSSESMISLRGIAFAYSLDREVLSWTGSHLSQTPAALDWTPTFFLKELHGSATFNGTAEANKPFTGKYPRGRTKAADAHQVH